MKIEKYLEEDSNSILPASVEAEQIVLGACLLEGQVVAEVVELLEPQMFYHISHRIVYESIVDLAIKNSPIDILIVCEHLKKRGVLQEIGGEHFVSSLTLRVASTAHLKAHCIFILDNYLKRKVVEYCHHLINTSSHYSTDGIELVDELLKYCSDLLSLLGRKKETSISKQVDEFFSKLKEISISGWHSISFPTGLKTIDSNLVAFRKGSLNIIGGRPGMGKTALAIQIAQQQGIDLKIPTIFFSLEMKETEVISRIVSQRARIDGDKMIKARLSDLQWESVSKALSDLKESCLTIDCYSKTIGEIVAKIKKEKYKGKLSTVYIDYLQLIDLPKEYTKDKTRDQQIGALTKILKNIAQELDLSVTVLAQLSRSTETTINKVPSLRDLRESGNIEQDADLCLLLYRPEYYKIYTDSEGKDLRGLARLICGKNRNGPLIDIDLKFDPSLTLFSDIESVYFGSTQETSPILPW